MWPRIRVRQPPHQQGHRRPEGRWLVHRRLHPGRAEDPVCARALAGAAQHRLRRSVPHRQPGRDPGLPGAAGRACQPWHRPGAGDQAPDLLPVDRLADGRQAPDRAAWQCLYQRRPGHHPVVRDRQPALPARQDPARQQHPPAATAVEGRHPAGRHRQGRWHADLRADDDPGRTEGHRQLRRRHRPGTALDHSAGCQGRAEHADHAGTGRTCSGADGDSVHLPSGEPLPGQQPAQGRRHRAQSRRFDCRDARLSGDRHDAFFTDDPALGRQAVDGMGAAGN